MRGRKVCSSPLFSSAPRLAFCPFSRSSRDVANRDVGIDSEAYYDLTYFYHRELKHSILSVLRALHQLADRIAEGLESPSGDGEDPPDSTASQKARDAKLLALVPKTFREACLEVEREIGEVRERREGAEWKGLGREGRRAAWRGHCERLVGVVEGSRGARQREVESLRGELRGEVRKL